MKTSIERMHICANDYKDNVARQLQLTIEQGVPSQLSEPAKTVLSVHLTRQVHLSQCFATNLDLWSIHIAPALLRCMYELNVRILWLLDEPDRNSKGFIKASVKETEELFKVITEKSDANPLREDLKLVKVSMKKWLEEQETSFPTMNAAKFIDVRKMAEKLQGEALEMYRLYNSSLSPAVHNSWNFIERVYLRPTSNPLHRYLRLPHVEFKGPNLKYFVSATSFADNGLKASSVNITIDSAFEKLLEQLQTSDSD